MNLDGIEVDALIDTGSMVTTITESLYNDHLIAMSPLIRDKVVNLKAANGMEIPYIGFICLDVNIGKNCSKTKLF